MTDSAPPNDMPATIGLPDPNAWLHAQVITIMRRWWLLPLGVAIAVLAALYYLGQARYDYSAELKIFAAPSTSGSRVASPIGGLAALAGAASGTTSEQISPFRFYLDGLYSPEVAALLARDRTLMRTVFAGQWDRHNQRWREPASLVGSIRTSVLGLLGLRRYDWMPPDAADLQDFIVQNVAVHQSVKSPVVSISMNYPDPVFAAQFLARLNRTTDDYLREQQASRTRANISFLVGQIANTTRVDQRAALIGALADEERQAMLAHGNAPYAAEPFDLVTTSLEPVRPRPGRLIAGAAVAGLLLGIAGALLIDRRRRHG